MTVGDLPAPEARRRLRKDGLCFKVGPYAIRARTALPRVAEGLCFLYSSFPLVPDDSIVDAELWVRAKPLLPLRATILVDGEAQFDWLPGGVVIPMAEWALNVSVFHRSHLYLMLHAAVVERGDRAAVLIGRAGSGKSTLCAALVHRGWRLLSDEVALIRPSDGCLQPVPRPVSLKEGSIEAVRRWAPDARFGPVWPRTSKGRLAHMLPPSDCVARADEPAMPHWIFFPRFVEGAPARVREVAKAHAFLRAADNSFNYSVLGRPAFDLLVGFIDRCSCFELEFGDLEAAVRTMTSSMTSA